MMKYIILLLILFIEIILIESKFIGSLKLNAINRKKFIVYLNIIVFLKKKKDILRLRK